MQNPIHIISLFGRYNFLICICNSYHISKYHICLLSPKSIYSNRMRVFVVMHKGIAGTYACNLDKFACIQNLLRRAYMYLCTLVFMYIFE